MGRACGRDSDGDARSVVCAIGMFKSGEMGLYKPKRRRDGSTANGRAAMASGGHGCEHIHGDLGDWVLS